jgi:hypothetical protein
MAIDVPEASMGFIGAIQKVFQGLVIGDIIFVDSLPDFFAGKCPVI